MRIDQPRASRLGNSLVAERVSDGSRFVLTPRFARFPLWHPTLVFAVAGIGVLRLRRFTLRSAIIATTVVAGLLGMAVIL